MKFGSFLATCITLVICSLVFAEDIREKVRKTSPQQTGEPVIDPEGVIYGVPFGATKDEVIAKFGKPQGYIQLDDHRAAFLYGESHLLLFYDGSFDGVQIGDSMIYSQVANLIDEAPPFTGDGWRFSNGLRPEMSLKKIKESVKDESRGDRHRLIYSTESTVVELGFARYSNRGDTDEAYLLHRVLIARKHDGGENWSRPFSRSFRESMKGQKMLGISPREGEKGMWVIYVFENSPADKAGMRPGDLITKLNGESLAGLTAGEFVKRVKKLDAVELEITSKAGTTRTVRLEPADASTFSNVLVGPNLDLLHLDTGDEAPDFEATAPDGKTIRLSELKGAPVLINFTATWCMPCKEEMPFLKAAYSKYKVQGFRIISVYLDDADKDVFAYAKELGADWPIHSDGKGWKNAVAEKYGVIGVPKNVLVGKDGKILHTNVRDARIEAAIEEALR